MRAHVIKDSVIVNTISVASLDFQPGLIDADKCGGTIGDGWDGKNVFPIEPPPPPEKSRVEILEDALINKGLLTPDDLKGK